MVLNGVSGLGPIEGLRPRAGKSIKPGELHVRLHENEMETAVRGLGFRAQGVWRLCNVRA